MTTMSPFDPFDDNDPFLPRNYGADELRRLQQEDDDDLGVVTPGQWPIVWVASIVLAAILGWWGITVAAARIWGWW